MNSVDELKARLQEASLAVERGISTTDFERAFLDVLRFVKAHPDCREECESAFVNALAGGSQVPWELVQFCMRELRWPRVREEALRIADETTDIRVKAIMRDIAAAYEEEWEDADLYEYYRNK